MKIIYVPILKAKKGEFDAITHLSERGIDFITPWFDVPQLDESARKKIEPIQTFLNKKASDLAKAWAGRTIFIDLPRWATNAQTENGEHVLPFLCNRLELLDVNVNPIVDYVRWEDPVYENALRGIKLENGRNFCIRLNMDADTIDDMSDSDYFNGRLLEIIKKLEIDPSKIKLLIDFGDVSKQSHHIDGMIKNAKQAIYLTRQIGFSQFMLAGCSLPPFISSAVKTQNTTGLVLRKEMLTWRTLLSETPSLDIVFADYGVRNPSSSDESSPFPNTNGKIRYTIDKEYFIARGHPVNSGYKYKQFNHLAKVIITSEYYLSSKFSWGDKQLFLYSDPAHKPGSHTTWVSIDTNHHIESVLMEVMEFKRQLLTSAHMV
ncbi:MAG: beta family protein [Methylococcales bacterium]|nr:beta family protein [Methylococcales bacterium]